MLLLIHAFTSSSRGLEGRTKLAKLDFFLRYPEYLRRALEIRDAHLPGESSQYTGAIEKSMIRYRYGPWDPAYFAILGRLQGKGLIKTRPGPRGALAYHTSELGGEIAESLAATAEWESVAVSAKLLRRYLDLSGTNLKRFVHEHFPEVTHSKWGDEL